MRCDDCQTEPLTPGHYCECCGRKLSVKEREKLGLEIALPAPTPVTAATVPRCESCGAPCTDGDLCAACHQAFESLLVPPTATPQTASNAEAPEVPESPSFVEIVLPPPTHPAIEVAAPAPAPAQTPEPVQATHAVQAPELVSAPSPAGEPHANTEVKAEPVATPEVKAQPLASPEANAILSRPAEAPAQSPRSQPAAVSSPAQVKDRRRSIGVAAAAVVIVAAIGFPLATYWLGRQQVITVMNDAQPADASAPAAASAPAPPLAVIPAPASKPVVEAPAPMKVSAPVAASRPVPAPIKPAASKPVPTRNVRPPARTAAPAPSPVAPPQPVVEVAQPAPEPVAPEPSPEPPAAAAGPFFEQRQVDQAPGVATRVEPQIPDSLRPINDVVVVRVLVSQSGHPSIVSLLRRSKSGSALDDAVVAAVKQWTFSPALKRGEAVSCWYHVGVPVTRTE